MTKVWPQTTNRNWNGTFFSHLPSHIKVKNGLCFEIFRFFSGFNFVLCFHFAFFATNGNINQTSPLSTNLIAPSDTGQYVTQRLVNYFRKKFKLTEGVNYGLFTFIIYKGFCIISPIIILKLTSKNL